MRISIIFDFSVDLVSMGSPIMDFGKSWFQKSCARLVIFGVLSGTTHATVTVINSPPSPVPSSVSTDTQLNVFAGAVIANDFKAFSGSEVNIAGGSVGTGFTSYSGSTVNVSGGMLRRFTVEGVVNVTGGTFDCCFRIISGGVANISGGSISNAVNVFPGGAIAISGGSIGHDFRALENSDVSVSGGSMGNGFGTAFSSRVHFFGGDYRLNGLPISNLSTVGNSRSFDVPVGATFSGTFADGTPFAFNTADQDFIADGTLTLNVVPLPPLEPLTFNLPGPAPSGLRSGQTLIMTRGGSVRDHFNADVGSTVQLRGGRIGNNFEAVGAQITISSGMVGTNFGAYHGTKVDMSGGAIDINFEAFPGSQVNITGGLVGDFLRAHDQSRVTISGGIVGKGLRAFAGSEVNITGGSVGDEIHAEQNSRIHISGGTVGANFQALNNSHVAISGGNIGIGFRAPPGSIINLVGRYFELNGTDISHSLTKYVPSTVSDRNMTLTGVLRDGSPFKFDLNSQFTVGKDYFSPAAMLSIILVPEPTSLALLCLGSICLLRRK